MVSSIGEIISRSMDFQSAYYSVAVQQIETEVWARLWTTDNAACSMSTISRLSWLEFKIWLKFKWHLDPEVRGYIRCITLNEGNVMFELILFVRHLFYIYNMFSCIKFFILKWKKESNNFLIMLMNDDIWPSVIHV